MLFVAHHTYMLLVYAVSAIVAGVLVALSVMGAGHDADHDIHLDAHHDTDGHEGSGGHWLPFFSLRFYTYFFAAFGTTGLLLHFLTKTESGLGIWISAIVGLLSGLGVSLAIRLLRLSETSGSAKEQDVLGKQGEVLVAIRGKTPGRVRCEVRGDIIDYTAITEEDGDIEAGQQVVVVSMENGVAQVMRTESIFGSIDLEKENNESISS